MICNVISVRTEDLNEKMCVSDVVSIENYAENLRRAVCKLTV